ncbi:hypothetical protein Tco_0063171, partial [Tanacetum coccineum]
RPDWLFDVDSLTISMNYVPVDAGKQTNDPKDRNVDAEKKANEVDESGASDKDGNDEQATRLNQREMQSEHTNSTKNINTISIPVSIAGLINTDNVPSSPVNTVGLSIIAANAFEEHIFQRFSPFKNASALPHVSNVSLI